MAERSFLYAFEALTDDLPRPPMAALRALLSAGVLVSARGWQELRPETRQQIARVGAQDSMDERGLTELVKQVPVSQLKFIGKNTDPSAEVVPAELVAALGPVRPLTDAEWRGLRAIDRYVLVALVKNTRLLGRALDETVPHKASASGQANPWSGSVARAELRVRHDVLQRILTAEFMDGRAFVLANVAGRRAARRAAEIFDQQAESTVGPVEIEWGLRANDDVVFWQAHVSAWDGAFFPAAALLAATSAAVALYDMVKGLDPTATLTVGAIREEPWQAGREVVDEGATAVFSKPSLQPGDPVPAGTIRDTLKAGRAAPREANPMLPSGGGFALQTKTLPLMQGSVPPSPASTPRLYGAAGPNVSSVPPVPSSIAGTPSSAPGLVMPASSGRGAPPSSGSGMASTRQQLPSRSVALIVTLAVVANLVVTLVIAAIFLSRR